MVRSVSAELRRNAASATPRFDEVLRRHRGMHDLGKPLVKADFEHALDVWQWLLRLSSEASLEAQVAALFHDVERLVSEPDVRIEHRAPDYQEFKDAHARAGAQMACDVLEGLLTPPQLWRVGHLIAHHERPGADEELALLNDADALSFFSLNSPGFLAYYGPEHTRRKVAYTLGRLRPERHSLLDPMVLLPVIRELVTEARRTGVAAPGLA